MQSTIQSSFILSNLIALIIICCHSCRLMAVRACSHRFYTLISLMYSFRPPHSNSCITTTPTVLHRCWMRYSKWVEAHRLGLELIMCPITDTLPDTFERSCVSDGLPFAMAIISSLMAGSTAHSRALLTVVYINQSDWDHLDGFMAQYPNEKDPHSNWVYPGRQGAYPPPQHPPNPYASRDGAPSSASGQSSSYAPPSQSQYHAPPPQEHDTSQGPPPDYGYVQSHPAGYNSKDETVLSPPPGYHDPPVPDGGPSSSSGQDGERGGIMMSIASFFGNKGPPPMWQRQAPPQLPYNAEFPPMCLISNGKDLSKGFPELPPPCQLNPHPFVTHDVAEEDWKRYVVHAVMALGVELTRWDLFLT